LEMTKESIFENKKQFPGPPTGKNAGIDLLSCSNHAHSYKSGKILFSWGEYKLNITLLVVS
jgi:hypothetical protein